MDTEIQSLDRSQQARVARWMVEHWGSEVMVAHGATLRPAELPGFVAIRGGEWVGLITYQVDGDACEIVTLDSLRPNIGVATALIEAVKQVARQAGGRRLWVITTNDNTAALRFYQKRGFHLVAVHRDAVTRSRQVKPQIPLIGNDGIPICDEIELEMLLDRSSSEIGDWLDSNRLLSFP
jgi:ribosomal protein S18 acetylase RimI-like enzyme